MNSLKQRTCAASILCLSFASLAYGACSDGGLVTLKPGDGGADDRAAGGDDGATDTGDDRVQGDTCGSPPYVTLNVSVLGASISAQTPLPGAKFTTPLCPDKYTITGDAGTFTGRISKNTPFYGRFEAANYIHMLTPEENFPEDTRDYKVVILPAIFGSLVPGFGATSTAIFIGAMKNGGTGACDQLDGISFSVDGHPEATILYYSPDQIPTPVDGATMTTASGRASITGLAPNQLVTIQSSKPGCVATMKKGEFTGRAPLEAGWMTLIGTYVSDLPDAGHDGGTDGAIGDANDGG